MSSLVLVNELHGLGGSPVRSRVAQRGRRSALGGFPRTRGARTDRDAGHEHKPGRSVMTPGLNAFSIAALTVLRSGFSRPMSRGPA